MFKSFKWFYHFLFFSLLYIVSLAPLSSAATEAQSEGIKVSPFLRSSGAETESDSIVLGFAGSQGLLRNPGTAEMIGHYLQDSLDESVSVREFSNERRLYRWIFNFREVDIAWLSNDFLGNLSVGELTPLVEGLSETSAHVSGKLVARQGFDDALGQQIRDLFLGMTGTNKGRELLAQMRTSGFVIPTKKESTEWIVGRQSLDKATQPLPLSPGAIKKNEEDGSFAAEPVALNSGVAVAVEAANDVVSAPTVPATENSKGSLDLTAEEPESIVLAEDTPVPPTPLPVSAPTVPATENSKDSLDLTAEEAESIALAEDAPVPPTPLPVSDSTTPVSVKDTGSLGVVAEEPEPIVLVEEAAVEPTPLPVSDPTIPFTVKSSGSRGEVAEEPEPIVLAEDAPVAPKSLPVSDSMIPFTVKSMGSRGVVAEEPEPIVLAEEAPVEPTPLPVSDPTAPVSVKDTGSLGVEAEEPEPIVLAEEAPVEPTPLPVSDPTIPFTVKSPGSRGVPAEEPEPIVLAEEAPAEPTPLPASDPTIPFTVKSMGSRGEVAEEPEPIVLAEEAAVEPTPLPVSDPTIPFTAKSTGARDGVDEQSKPFAGEAKVQPPEVVTGGAQVEPLPVTNTKAEQPEVVADEIEPEPLMAADIKAQPEVDDSLAMAEQDADESAPASPVRKDALLEPETAESDVPEQAKQVAEKSAESELKNQLPVDAPDKEDSVADQDAIDATGDNPPGLSELFGVKEIPVLSGVDKRYIKSMAGLQTTDQAVTKQVDETNLSASIAASRSFNRESLAAKERTAQAKAQTGQALGLLLPSVSVRVNSGKERSEPSVVIDPETEELIGSDTHTRTDASLTVRQPLFDLPRYLDWQRRKVTEKAREENYRITDGDAYLSTVNTYLSLVSSRLQADVTRNFENQLAELLSYIEKRASAGAASISDMARVRARIQSTLSSRLEQESAHATAGTEFVRLTNVAPQRVRLPQVEDIGALSLPRSFENAIETAMQYNPEVKSLATELQAARIDQDAARGRYLPRFEAEYTDTYTDGAGGSPDTQRDKRLMAVVSWDLYSGGKDKQYNLERFARTKELQYRLDDQRRRVVQALSANYTALETTRERLKTSYDELEAITTATEAMSKRMLSGNQSLLDLLDVYDRYYQARARLVSLHTLEMNTVAQIIRLTLGTPWDGATEHDSQASLSN